MSYFTLIIIGRSATYVGTLRLQRLWGKSQFSRPLLMGRKSIEAVHCDHHGTRDLETGHKALHDHSPLRDLTAARTIDITSI